MAKNVGMNREQSLKRDALLMVGEWWRIKGVKVKVNGNKKPVLFFKITSQVSSASEIELKLSERKIPLVSKREVENDKILNLLEVGGVLVDERNLVFDGEGGIKGDGEGYAYPAFTDNPNINIEWEGASGNRELMDSFLEFFNKSIEFEIDKRTRSSSENLIRFNYGWGKSNKAKRKKRDRYSSDQLRLLTWENLGYRFGLEYGVIPENKKQDLFRMLAVQHDGDDGHDFEQEPIPSGPSVFSSSSAKEIGPSVGLGKESLLSSDPKKIEDLVTGLLEAGVGKKPDGQLEPRRRPSEGPGGFVRDASVKAWVLANAKGVCELCLLEAPFKKADGQPYLEVHHPHTLAKGGADVVENAVALCPSCHRELHYGAMRDDRLDQLYSQSDRLVP